MPPQNADNNGANLKNAKNRRGNTYHQVRRGLDNRDNLKYQHKSRIHWVKWVRTWSSLGVAGPAPGHNAGHALPAHKPPG